MQFAVLSKVCCVEMVALSIVLSAQRSYCAGPVTGSDVTKQNRQVVEEAAPEERSKHAPAVMLRHGI